MLALRRGVVRQVVTASEPDHGVAELVVEIGAEMRPAYADVGLVGPVEPGDEVVVNIEAVELKLGSGGQDVVLVNLTQGLSGLADPSMHVMKLNYSPLQHGVTPVEAVELEIPVHKPATIFQLHGQLPCVVWSALEQRPGLRIGYVQTAGGALPGSYSRTVVELRRKSMLCDHLTAAPAYGGDAETISTIGAIHAGLTERGWDCAVVGPGPGIIGSATALGHGGMVALDSAHAALSLGCETIVVARASMADPRERHRGISHHTETVLELLLKPVTLALSHNAPPPASINEHRLVTVEVDLDGYRQSGLPSRTMGRTIDQDPLFFEQALAAGAAMAHALPVA